MGINLGFKESLDMMCLNLSIHKHDPTSTCFHPLIYIKNQAMLFISNIKLNWVKQKSTNSSNKWLKIPDKRQIVEKKAI